MIFSRRVQFFSGIVDFFFGVTHLIVQLVDLLATLLDLNCQILGYGVDILHYVRDGVDVLLTLLDDSIIEIGILFHSPVLVTELKLLLLHLLFHVLATLVIYAVGHH